MPLSDPAELAPELIEIRNPAGSFQKTDLLPLNRPRPGLLLNNRRAVARTPSSEGPSIEGSSIPSDRPISLRGIKALI